MTFSKTVKNELVTVPVETQEMLAEYAAFLNLSVDFHIENKAMMLDFKSNNPTVAKRFLKLSKSLYQADTLLITKENNRFNNKRSVIVRVHSKVDFIINEHSLLDNPYEAQSLLTQTDETKRAYLRAAFLISGSINHPKTAEYHLEIYTTESREVIFLQQLMNYFELNAKIIERRKGFVVYLKEAEAISDFLRHVGALNAVFEFEDSRIKRDFNNSINRVMNCEIANEQKTIIAANQQLADIELIESMYLVSDIDEKVKRIITLRKKYPEANLRELVEMYVVDFGEKISKSGMNHRLLKIKSIADAIREGR